MLVLRLLIFNFSSLSPARAKNGVEARLGKAGRMSVLLVRDFVKPQTETKHMPRYPPLPYFLGFLMLACAAAKRAIGTLYGEQET